MIGEFRSASRVSVFQGSLLVIVIMIDGSENAIVKAAFELLKSSHVCKSAVSLGTRRSCLNISSTGLLKYKLREIF